MSRVRNYSGDSSSDDEYENVEQVWIGRTNAAPAVVAPPIDIVMQPNAARPSVCDPRPNPPRPNPRPNPPRPNPRPPPPNPRREPPPVPNVTVGSPCGPCSILWFLILLVVVAVMTLRWDDIVAILPPIRPGPNTTIPIYIPGGPDNERLCRLEKAVAEMQKDFKTSLEFLDQKLKNAIEESTIGRFPEKILQQIMNVEIGTYKGKPLTLRNLILAVKDNSEKETFETDEKLIKIMDERLEKFKQKLVICGPRIPPGQWCISADGTADLTKLKEELTTFLVQTIKEELNRAPPHSDVGDIVKRAIDKYDADKTALPDLALEPGGGRIVSCGKTVSNRGKNAVIKFMGIPVWSKINEANTIIQPGIVPGECWSFEGEGLAVVQLVGPALITGVSLEHMPKVNSPSGRIDEAPKDFQISGFMDYNDPRTEFNFGEYQYLDNYEPLQYFSVKRKSDIYFPYIQLKVKSHQNHSFPYTCIYRFRVHGKLFGMMPHILPIPNPGIPGSPGPGPQVPGGGTCAKFD